MTDNGSSDDHPLAGQGRLAQLIATRGGKASPEAPFVSTDWIEVFQRWVDTGLRP